jgi:glycosyltransferase involved in cell wall biosynthesis
LGDQLQTGEHAFSFNVNMGWLRMEIGIIGDEDSGKKLVRHLNDIGVSAKFVSAGLLKNPGSLFHLSDYDIVHGVYVRKSVVVSLIFGKVLGKCSVCHWEGSDVMRAIKETGFRLMALMLNNFVDLNITFSENLQKELKHIGIDSVVWPIPVDSQYFLIEELPPMPERFSVLCKIADDWLYGSDTFLKLAKDLPDVRFLVVPGKDKQPSKLLTKIREVSNVDFLGWKNDMLEVYKQSSALLRLTAHDGLSYMVVEALALGRQVIWSHNYLPFCHYVKSYDQIKKAILGIQKNPKLNVEGAHYVRKNFNSEHAIKELVRIYDWLASGKK